MVADSLPQLFGFFLQLGEDAFDIRPVEAALLRARLPSLAASSSAGRERGMLSSAEDCGCGSAFSACLMASQLRSTWEASIPASPARI